MQDAIRACGTTYGCTYITDDTPGTRGDQHLAHGDGVLHGVQETHLARHGDGQIPTGSAQQPHRKQAVTKHI